MHFRQTALKLCTLLVMIPVSLMLNACATPNVAPASATPMQSTQNTVVAQSTIPAAAATRTPLPSLTPSATVAGVANAASSTVAPTIAATIAQSATQAATTASTQAGPTSTSALLAVTVLPSTTPLPPAALLPGTAPAIDIKLPTGWKAEYYVVPIREALVQASVNLARYYGPVSNNGMGTILVLWGFPSIGAPPTAAAPGPTATPLPNVTPLSYQQQLLWSDGIRLLQGTVVEITCNVGTYEQRFFQIGPEIGIGAYFNVSQCPDEPDTVGWFAGMNASTTNYLFYAYVEPIQAYNEGRVQLQSILDTVTFKAPAIPTNTPKP